MCPACIRLNRRRLVIHLSRAARYIVLLRFRQNPLLYTFPSFDSLPARRRPTAAITLCFVCGSSISVAMPLCRRPSQYLWCLSRYRCHDRRLGHCLASTAGTLLPAAGRPYTLMRTLHQLVETSCPPQYTCYLDSSRPLIRSDSSDLGLKCIL